MRYKIIDAEINGTKVAVKYARYLAGRYGKSVIEIDVGIDTEGVSFDANDVTLILKLQTV